MKLWYRVRINKYDAIFVNIVPKKVNNQFYLETDILR